MASGPHSRVNRVSHGGVVVVEWMLIKKKKTIAVGEADLSEIVSLVFVRNMCFCSESKRIFHFPKGKTTSSPNG